MGLLTVPFVFQAIDFYRSIDATWFSKTALWSLKNCKRIRMAALTCAPLPTSRATRPAALLTLMLWVSCNVKNIQIAPPFDGNFNYYCYLQWYRTTQGTNYFATKELTKGVERRYLVKWASKYLVTYRIKIYIFVWLYQLLAF
jgi:hypothetical protein